jgi:hypothetical protein
MAFHFFNCGWVAHSLVRRLQIYIRFQISFGRLGSECFGQNKLDPAVQYDQVLVISGEIGAI